MIKTYIAMNKKDQAKEIVEYLKNNYPFLFSLAVRTNPFNKEASVVFTAQ